MKTLSFNPKTSTTPKERKSLAKPLSIILLIAGILGLFCALAILNDKMQTLANPNYQALCDVNPVISCGSVLDSKQSSAFGFSNPYIGLAAFPALAAIGAGMLAGGRYKRWFWIGLQTGTVFGLVFVHWLFVQSVYEIGALCPYCIVVWIATITTFWYVTLFNIEQGNLAVTGKFRTFTDALRRHHLDILLLWFIVIAALILKHFWYYYGQYFS